MNLIKRYRIARTVMDRRSAIKHASRKDWREIKAYQ